MINTADFIVFCGFASVRKTADPQIDAEKQPFRHGISEWGPTRRAQVLSRALPGTRPSVYIHIDFIHVCYKLFLWILSIILMKSLSSTMYHQ